jgi:hypothetical protein
MKTMKQWMLLLTLILGLSCLEAQTLRVDSLQVLKQDGRITNLEMMRDNLSRELDLHKQELTNSVYRTNVLVILGIVTAVFGVGWILLGIKNLRTFVLVKAESLIEEELKRKLPASMRNRVRDFVDKVIPEEIEPFLAVIRQKKREEAAKASTKMALLAENLDKGQVAEKDFRDAGFKDVLVYVPTSDQLPEADVYVFVRKEPKPDEGWNKVSDQFIKRVLDQNRSDETKLFFYYGPYNTALDSKMHPRFGLANMPSTISNRIVELLLPAPSKSQPV